MATDLTSLGVSVQLNNVDKVNADLAKLRDNFKQTKAEAEGLKNLNISTGGSGGSGIKNVADDVEKASVSAKNASASFGLFSNQLGGASQSLINFSRGLGLIGALGQISAIYAIGQAVRTMISAITDGDAAMAQLEVRVRTLGGNIGLTVPQLVAMAQAGEKLTTFSQVEIEHAQALALQFDNIGKVVFPQAIAAILNMSTALGRDLESSAVLVSKALSDPIGALTQLRRVGVVFTADQRELIKTLVETGYGAKAQAIEINALNKEFGGAAEAAKNTLGGAFKTLKNTIGDFARDTGPFNAALKEMIGNINSLLKGQSGQGFGEALASGIHNAEDAAALLAQSIRNIKEAGTEIAAYFQGQFAIDIGGTFQNLKIGLANALGGKLPIHSQVLGDANSNATLSQFAAGLPANTGSDLGKTLNTSANRANTAQLVGSSIDQLQKALTDNAAQVKQDAIDLTNANEAADAAKNAKPFYEKDLTFRGVRGFGVLADPVGVGKEYLGYGPQGTADINGTGIRAAQAQNKFQTSQGNQLQTEQFIHGLLPNAPVGSSAQDILNLLKQQSSKNPFGGTSSDQPSSAAEITKVTTELKKQLDTEATRAELEQKIAKSSGETRYQAEYQLASAGAIATLHSKGLIDSDNASKTISEYLKTEADIPKAIREQLKLQDEAIQKDARRIANAKDLNDTQRQYNEALQKAQAQANSAASGILGTIGSKDPLLQAQFEYAKSKKQLGDLAQARGGNLSVSELNKLDQDSLSAIVAKANGLDTTTQNLKETILEAGNALESSFSNALVNTKGIRDIITGLLKDLGKIGIQQFLIKPAENTFKSALGIQAGQIKNGVDTSTAEGKILSQLAAGQISIDAKLVQVNASSILGKDAQGNSLAGAISGSANPSSASSNLPDLGTEFSNATAADFGNGTIMDSIESSVKGFFTDFGGWLTKGFGALSGAFGGASGGGSGSALGSIGTFIASAFLHDGGVVGESGAMRMMPASVFHGASRYHSGLAGDEFPAILQKGEQVIPRGQSTAPTINFHVTNTSSGAKAEQPTVSRGSNGQINIGMVIRDHIKNDIASGGPIAQQMQSTYGVSRRAIGR